MLPFRQEVFQVSGFQINGRVKLLHVCFLGALDLAVKARAAWLVGAEFYAILHKPPLNLLRKKLHPAIGLDPLRWKRQLFKYLVQKIKRVARSAFFVDLEHPVVRAVVYRRVPAQIRGYFARGPSVSAGIGRRQSVYIPPSSFSWVGLARGLQSFRLKTLCITDTDREIAWRHSSSLRSRLGPNFRFFLRPRIDASVYPSTFFRGERMGRRLWLRRPVSPCAWYRLDHLRNVGLDIPHLLQVGPASLVCSYSFTQASRFFLPGSSIGYISSR